MLAQAEADREATALEKRREEGACREATRNEEIIMRRFAKVF